MRFSDDAPLITDRLAHDRANTEELVALFQRLCLPVPTTEQCLRRSHGDWLLPVTQAGCTVLITSRRISDPIRHPHVLQPLGEVQVGRWTARIMPGTHLRATDDASVVLHARLTMDGLNYNDPVTDNMGNLPFYTPQFPQGFPVVIDRNAVTPTSDFKPEHHPRHTDPQHTLYAPLRQLLAEAQAQKPELVTAAMRGFWKECAKQTYSPSQNPSGILVSGWLDVGKGYGETGKSRDFSKIAKNYRPSISTYWASIDLAEPNRSRDSWGIG